LFLFVIWMHLWPVLTYALGPLSVAMPIYSVRAALVLPSCSGSRHTIIDMSLARITSTPYDTVWSRLPHTPKSCVPVAILGAGTPVLHFTGPCAAAETKARGK
jgi:hypothetical protein